MANPPPMPWERDLARSAMAVLFEQTGLSEVDLGEALHGERNARHFDRHASDGRRLRHAALKKVKPLSEDAAFILAQWKIAFERKPNAKARRRALKDTFRRLGVGEHEIAEKLSRETPYLAGGDYPVHDPVRRVFVELVMLRRHKKSAPVHCHIDYIYQTGVVLLDACATSLALRFFAPKLWQHILAFAPTEKEFRKFGDWSLAAAPRPRSASDETWRQRHGSMVDFVPAMLEGRAIEWFPPLVKPPLVFVSERLQGISTSKPTRPPLYPAPEPSSFVGQEIATKLKRMGCPPSCGWGLWREYQEFIFPSPPTLRSAVRYARSTVRAPDRESHRDNIRGTVAVLHLFAEWQRSSNAARTSIH